MTHNNLNKDDANVLFWTYIASLIVIIVVLVIALLRIKGYYDQSSCSYKGYSTN